MMKKIQRYLLAIVLIGVSCQTIALASLSELWQQYGSKRNIALAAGSIIALAYTVRAHVNRVPVKPLSEVIKGKITQEHYAKNESPRDRKQRTEVKSSQEELVTIFSHGLRSNDKAAHHRHVQNSIASKRPGAFIEGPLLTFNFRDAQKPSLANFGQMYDVELLEKAILESGNRNKILTGSSRGSATCLNYIGNKSTTGIQAVVVESPFASIETLITSWWKKKIFQWCFPEYDPNGYQPLASARNVPTKLPIFIFCSKDDEVVPVSQTIEYYKELRKRGHKKVHLLVVEKGAHAKILNHKEEGEMVRNAIHAFYEQYGLPCNKNWAKAGKETFEKKCQPTFDQVDAISRTSKMGTWASFFKIIGSMSGSR